MNKEVIEFLDTGILKYKEAHEVYWRFRSEIKEVLNSIISNRENYGSISIDRNSMFFKNWGNGLYLTYRIGGQIKNLKLSIGIGIDWDENYKGNPIPFAWIEDENRKYIKLQDSYNWSNNRYNKNQQLGYFKDFNIIELESIFNNLLDEIIEYIETEL